MSRWARRAPCCSRASSLPGLVALAHRRRRRRGRARSTATRYLARSGRFASRAGGREQVAFYLRGRARSATAPKRRRACCAAAAGASCSSATRDALQSLEQSTGNEAIDRLINRNLLFAYFYARRPRARRRAVLSRSHARAVERPRRDGARLGSAHVDDSGGAARRSAARARAAAAHVRAARLRAGPRRPLPRRHAVRAGLRARGRRELRRSRPTDTFATRATIASSTSRRSPTRCISRAEDLDARRDKRVPLYSTEVSPSGAPAAHPFTLHANAAAAQALDVLRRTLDEETARGLQDPDAVRAAINAPLRRRDDGQPRDVRVGDRSRGHRRRWTTIRRRRCSGCRCIEAVARQDSTYRRTVKQIDVTPHLVRAAVRAAGRPGRDERYLQWLRRAPLDGGLAAEVVDADGTRGRERRRCVAVGTARVDGVVRGERAWGAAVGGLDRGRVRLRLARSASIYFGARGNSSVGRAQPCQGWGRGFESRFPLSRGEGRVEGCSLALPLFRAKSHCSASAQTAL